MAVDAAPLIEWEDQGVVLAIAPPAAVVYPDKIVAGVTADMLGPAGSGSGGTRAFGFVA